VQACHVTRWLNSSHDYLIPYISVEKPPGKDIVAGTQRPRDSRAEAS